jgi:hypothetical protein
MLDIDDNFGLLRVLVDDVEDVSREQVSRDEGSIGPDAP